MLSERDLSRLILAAYDAASAPERWSAFLQQFAECARGAHAAILLNDYSRQRYNVADSYNVDPEAQRLYQAHYAEKDAYYIAGRGELCAGWCGTSQMLISDDKLAECEFYRDYQRYYDMFHSCIAVMRFDSSAISCLTLLRSRRRGPFGKEQIKLSHALLPHLQKALELHRRVIELRVTSENLEQALALTPMALVLVAPTAKVLFATVRAKRLFSSQNGLCIRAGYLEAARSNDSSALRTAIRRASGIDFGSLDHLSSSLTIRRELPKRPLAISVYPLRPAMALTTACDTVVAVFVFDPDEILPRLDQVLHTAFGLTPAEIRLASLMATGDSLNHVAALLGVSRNTVKTQLRNVFHKTGTSTQNRLIHLLTSLNARLPGR